MKREILMTVESASGFAAAMFILAVTPGPGVFAAVSQALSSGFRSSLELIAGIVLGDIVFLLTAIFGLSALVHILGDLFFIVRLAGGLYLIRLGWKMLTAEPDISEIKTESRRSDAVQRFFSGFLLTLANPKVILFYAGFLPGFIDLTCLKYSDILIIIGLIVAILASVLSAYSYSASRARKFFSGGQSLRNLNRCSGSLMIGTGMLIAIRQ